MEDIVSFVLEIIIELSVLFVLVMSWSIARRQEKIALYQPRMKFYKKFRNAIIKSRKTTEGGIEGSSDNFYDYYFEARTLFGEDSTEHLKQLPEKLKEKDFDWKWLKGPWLKYLKLK